MVAAAATTNSIGDGDNANLDRLRHMLLLLVPILLSLTTAGLRSFHDAASLHIPKPMRHSYLHLSMSEAATSLGVHSPGLRDIVRR
jgi:hypothetical protein